MVAVGGRWRRREQHRRHHAEVVHDGGAAFARARPASSSDGSGRAAPGSRRPPAPTMVENGHRVHVIERQRRDDALRRRDGCRTRRRARHTTRRRAGSRRWRACSPWAGRWCPRCRAGAHSVSRRSASPARGARGRRARHCVVGPPSLAIATPACGRGGAQVGRALGQGHGQADLAVADQVDQLGRAHLGVDRHHAHAERVEREPVEEERGPVLEQQADAVAVAVAGFARRQRAGARPRQRPRPSGSAPAAMP